MGDENVPLADAVRSRVLEVTGNCPEGPIRLLTGLGFLWQRFNPVSFYYCFDTSGERLHYVVAEVTNTPWGEQYSYVLDARQQLHGDGNSSVEAGALVETAALRFVTEKRFHVSPFLPMDLVYYWKILPPGEQLAVAITERRAAVTVFHAGMSLQRQPLSGLMLARNFIRVPMVTMKIVATIYWQAFRLWLKATPFFSHPATDTGESK